MAIKLAAGRMQKVITIQSSTDTTDSYGGPVHTWADFATVRASAEPLSGRELIAAQAAQSATTMRFRMRYYPGIDSKMRIVYSGKQYNISAIIDTDEMHRELVIMAETGLNEG